LAASRVEPIEHGSIAALLGFRTGGNIRTRQRVEQGSCELLAPRG